MAAEANVTMFEPITQALLRYFQEADRRMRAEVPLQDWAAERYMDMILSVHWLLENAPQGQEQFLWDLAELCKEQGESELLGGAGFSLVLLFLYTCICELMCLDINTTQYCSMLRCRLGAMVRHMGRRRWATWSQQWYIYMYIYIAFLLLLHAPVTLDDKKICRWTKPLLVHPSYPL